MKIAKHSITVAPAVLALNDVTASEKLLLALYAAEPNAKNFIAMQVLGVGLAGLKKIKKRLFVKNYLFRKATGYVVDIPGFSSEPEESGGHLVSNLSGVEKENKVAPAPAPLKKERSLEEILKSFDSTWHLALRMRSHVDTLYFLVQSTFDSIEDLPDGLERNYMLADFTVRRDAFFALSYAANNLPRQYQRQVDRLIATSSPEQLAKLRVGIEQAKLTGAKPVFLLAEL